MRSDKRKTENFDGMKYSPELIRELENPEFAREADRYEQAARRRKRAESARSGRRSRSGRTADRRRPQEQSFDDSEINELNAEFAEYGVDFGEGNGQAGKGRAEGRRAESGSGKSRGTSKKKYKVNKKTIAKNILSLVLVLAVCATGVFFYLTRNFDKVDTDKGAFGIDPQVASDMKGYRNIAILGVDARADEGYDGSRTDAIIIMSIKKTTGDVRLISVMRDSYLQMDGFEGQPILDKVTHAHHYAGGVNTCKALNQSLDLNIDEFIIFNWTAVADAVDSLGGVEINVKENEIGDLNIWGPETARNVGRKYHRIEKTGKQTLDGVQATTYCRIRKNSGGDEGRSQRYKKVVAAVMKKALVSPQKLNELSARTFPNVRTNMSQLEMFTAAARAPFYDLKKSISWPKDYYSGLLNDGVAYVVPITLESNVKELHRRAFGQDDYQVSQTCSQISDSIIYDTGIQ